jgi:antiviral helicase SKI2
MAAKGETTEAVLSEKVLNIKFAESKPQVDGGSSFSKWVTVLNANEEMDSFDELFPDPAFTYPFELDTFQKQAIKCLERHDNVFVAAHTSAGKTVVAEYAIAMALKRNHNKVIYTSPVKALSNQKFRDFKKTFGSSEVGILTGDIQIQPEAPCLVMTTEILLQMLYNSSDVIAELEWVIFDEVHYCNDPDRGHVWEKIFILLPDHIRLVLLSATVSNTCDFADWLGRTRTKKTYVISTTKRPVPLEHYLFVGKTSTGQEEKFLLIDSESKLRDEGYREAVLAMKEKEAKVDKLYTTSPGLSPHAERNYMIGMIRHLQKDDRLPLIIFTLSRKKCYANATSLSSTMDLSTGEEASRIHRYTVSSLAKLKPHDRKIKQIVDVSEMLKRGFGIHHSGVLPILKEITENLFAKGLVKVLFATETFAMGVNMPARTVAFDSIDKHDGIQERRLHASEYIQMAGRAGRRGKDKTGTVLILCRKNIPEISELAKMALGKPAHLESQFKLTYHMILNLIQTRHYQNIECIMGRSFIEHGKQQALQQKIKQKEKLQEDLNESPLPQCDLCVIDLEAFCTAYLAYVSQLEEVMHEIAKKAVSKRIFSSGRLVLFESDRHPFTLGVIISANKGFRAGALNMNVLAFDAIELLTHGPSNLSFLQVMPITSDQLHMILARVEPNVDGDKINQEMNTHQKSEIDAILTSLFHYLKGKDHELAMTSASGLILLPAFDPRKELKMNQIEFVEKLNRVNYARQKAVSFTCVDCPKIGEHMQLGMIRNTLLSDLERVKFELSPESMMYLPEYKKRLRVLQELGYINAEGFLEMKGKVACLFKEHEIILTEIIFDNVLQGLSTSEIAGLLSGFVFQQKSDCSAPVKSPELQERITRIKAITNKIGKTQEKCGLKRDVDFVGELKFDLCNLCYEWAEGKTFKEVVEGTDIEEGIIVRALQRLDEIIADIRSAAEMYGDTSLGDGSSLVEKLDATSLSVRRDIAFSASLYIQDEEDDNAII